MTYARIDDFYDSHPTQPIESDCESDSSKVDALLADKDFFIDSLTTAQKDELLSCLMTSLYGWPSLSRGEPEEQRLKRIVRAARDDFSEIAHELIEADHA